MRSGVSRVRQYNYSSPVDYGYIIIPTKVDRDEYVATCYRRERVTIVGDNGTGMIKDCYISREALREIEFPIDSDELGVGVTYIVNSFNNTPIIVGRISKEGESQLLEEGEFRLEKEYNNSKVSVTGRAKTGDLLIDVENNDGTGSLVINVTGKEDGSSLKINVKGDATIYSDDTVNLETAGEVNIKSIDENDETKFSIIKVTNNNVNITPVDGGTFTISNGGEPIVLGTNNSDILNDIQSLLSDYNTYLDTFTTATSAAAVEPTLGPASAALKVSLATMVTAISALVNKISNNNSEISFTD